jgi:oxaloacetate decarboxylase beta subunit
MTDFSALISNPKLLLIGAAAQFGIFGAYAIALLLGFSPAEAGAIGIIGGADGPTAIFLSSRLAPDLMGAIAVSAYSYMALVPVIQPPIMRLLTNRKERLIKMKPPRAVSQTEKKLFPIIGFLMTAFIVPSGLPLLGMLFFGNLLKESGVTRRLAETARGPLIDVITILIGVTVGCSTQADKFLQLKSVYIFGIGALSFVIATATGVLFVKLINTMLKEGSKINPLIGNAGVSAVPDSACNGSKCCRCYWQRSCSRYSSRIPFVTKVNRFCIETIFYKKSTLRGAFFVFFSIFVKFTIIDTVCKTSCKS